MDTLLEAVEHLRRVALHAPDEADDLRGVVPLDLLLQRLHHLAGKVDGCAHDTEAAEQQQVFKLKKL